MSAYWTDHVLAVDGGYRAELRGPRRATHAAATVDRDRAAIAIDHAIEPGMLHAPRAEDFPGGERLHQVCDALGVPGGRPLSERLSLLAMRLEMAPTRDEELAEAAQRFAAREAELLARIAEVEGMADTLAAAEEDATRRPSLRRFLRRLVTLARVR